MQVWTAFGRCCQMALAVAHWLSQDLGTLYRFFPCLARFLSPILISPNRKGEGSRSNGTFPFSSLLYISQHSISAKQTVAIAKLQQAAHPSHTKRNQALSPRRGRMRPRSRSRTISVGLRIAQMGAQTDLHRLYPSHPFHKSFCQAFFKKPRSPRLPRSPNPAVVNQS